MEPTTIRAYPSYIALRLDAFNLDMKFAISTETKYVHESSDTGHIANDGFHGTENWVLYLEGDVDATTNALLIRIHLLFPELEWSSVHTKPNRQGQSRFSFTEHKADKLTFRYSSIRVPSNALSKDLPFFGCSRNTILITYQKSSAYGMKKLGTSSNK